MMFYRKFSIQSLISLAGIGLLASSAYAAPTISSLSPAAGGIEGGTKISIIGTGFVNGATVTIDGASCTSPVVASSTLMSCLTQAHSIATVNVVVTNPNNESATRTNGFQFKNAPQAVQSGQLKLWLKADALSQSNDARISSWTDSSGSGNTVTQSTFLSRPIYRTGVVNGLPVVRFSGAERLVKSGYTNSPTKYTLFLVSRRSSGAQPAGWGAPLSLSSTGRNTFFVYDSGNISMGDPYVEYTSYEAMWNSTTDFILWTISVAVTGSQKTVKLYANGTYLGTGTSTATVGSAWDNITVGDVGSNAGYYFNGDVAEAIGFVNLLNDNERESIENYLNAKYALYSPKILSLSRWTGSANGGTSLTINGSGFRPGVSAKLGANSCTALTYESAAKLTCVTPSHNPGSVDVVVTNPDSSVATAANAFNYGALVADPSTVYSLGFWIRPEARSDLSNGDSVQQALDSTSNTFLLTQHTNAQRPTYSTASGIPVYQFAGSNRLQNLSTNLNTVSAYTIFLLSRKSASAQPAGWGAPFGMSSNGRNTFFVYDSGNISFGDPYVEYTSMDTMWTETSSFNLWSFVVYITGSGQIAKIYKNGTYLGSGSSTVTVGGLWNGITLGDVGSNGGYYFNGDVAEVLAYTTGLSDVNREAVENYFNVKYAIYPPKILSLSRWTGSASGADSLTVGGAGFQAGSVVKLGGTSCTSTTFVNNGKLICVTPAHASGMVNVTVTNPDNQVATASNSYNFGAAATDPSDISGLNLWMKADSRSDLSDMGLIQQEMDSSASNFLWTQHVDAARPSYRTDVVNGKPVFRFDGGQRLQNLFTRLNPSSYTLFILSRKSSNPQPAGWGAPIGLSTTGRNTLFVYDSGNVCYGDPYVEYTTFDTMWDNATDFILWTVVVPAAGSGKRIRLYRDGSYLGMGGTVTVGNAWYNIVLGDLGSQAGYYYNGDIAEVIAYGSALSDVDRGAVETYFNQKYNLNGGNFSYSPKILALSRWSGSASGGASLDVVGSGFTSGSVISVGGVNCSSTTFVSNTKLTCTTPAHATGLANVKVTAPDNKTATVSNAFAFRNSILADPPDVSGLQIWLRSDSRSDLSDGDTAQQAIDSSANNWLWTQDTAGLRPVYKTGIANSAPVYRFDGARRLENLYTTINPSAYTIFIVARKSVSAQPAGWGAPFGLSASGRNTLFVYDNGDLSYGDPYVEYTTFPGAWSDTSNFTLWTIVVSSSGSGRLVEIFKNGVSQGTGSTTATVGTAWSKVVLGDVGSAAGYYYNGDIAEMVIYNSNLSSTLRGLIHTYLNTKFGLY